LPANVSARFATYRQSGMPPDSERQDLGAMTAVIAEQGARGVAMLESGKPTAASPKGGAQ